MHGVRELEQGGPDPAAIHVDNESTIFFNSENYGQESQAEVEKGRKRRFPIALPDRKNAYKFENNFYISLIS